MGCSVLDFIEAPDGEGRGRVVRARQAGGQRYGLEWVAQ